MSGVVSIEEEQYRLLVALGYLHASQAIFEGASTPKGGQRLSLLNHAPELHRIHSPRDMVPDLGERRCT